MSNMFDVDWSDPNRESVGDRRARKRREREEKSRGEGQVQEEGEENGEQDKNDGQQSSQTSGYGSVRSSLSSVDKQFGFFGGRSRRLGRDSVKTKSTKAKSTKTMSTASSSLRSPTIHITTNQEPSQERDQEQSPDDDTTYATSLPSPASPRSPGPVQPQGTSGLPRKRFSSFSGVVYRKWDENTSGASLLGYDMANPRPGTRTSLTQDLGDGVSSITKSIEVTSRTRTEKDGDYLVFEMTISTGAPQSKPKDSVLSKPFPSQPLPQVAESSQYLPTVPESPPSPSLEEARHLGPIISISTPSVDHDFSRGISRHNTKPRLDAPPIVPTSQRYIGNPFLWKAPDDWGYRPTETAVSPVDEPEAIVPTGTEEENRLALDLTSMQRSATRMLQASPQTILLRLKGAWGSYDSYSNDVTGQRDSTTAAIESALMYKELEMEKKRWMICALRHMDSLTDPDAVLSQPKEKPKAQRILSLFDNQATASYLACLHPGVPVYHLSPDPLARRQYPNVHPLPCPFVSASSAAGLAAAAAAGGPTGGGGGYSTVSCLPIASAVPSSEIPSLLAGVHRALAPGGSLDMVVLDPLPAAGPGKPGGGGDGDNSAPAAAAGPAAGPALRRWLDENLVFNLEQQFRCTNPSRNFPVWLQEARLRARGSVITTTRFQAVVPQKRRRRRQRRHCHGEGQGEGKDGGEKDGEEGGEEGGEEEEEEDNDDDDPEVAARRELRAVVGRMLWQDIWGPFVTADRWWWDVPEIVDECAALGTHWEYSIIVARKEADG